MRGLSACTAAEMTRIGQPNRPIHPLRERYASTRVESGEYARDVAFSLLVVAATLCPQALVAVLFT
jgi:hypothetical protein